MKNQALFSSKDKCRKLKCRLLQFLFGALMVSYKIKIDHILQDRSGSLGLFCYTSLGCQYSLF